MMLFDDYLYDDDNILMFDDDDDDNGNILMFDVYDVWCLMFDAWCLGNIVNYTPLSDTVLNRVGDSIISFVFMPYIMFEFYLCDGGFLFKW